MLKIGARALLWCGGGVSKVAMYARPKVSVCLVVYRAD